MDRINQEELHNTDPFIGSRLFLSVDIVGSTAYKQAKKDKPEQWVKEFLSFYYDFPAMLQANFCSEGNHEVPPTLWKAVGDELIFQTKIVSVVQVASIWKCWEATLDEYEKDTLVKEGLSLKSGVFIATFPSPDREVAIELKNPEVAEFADPEYRNKRNLKELNERQGELLLDFIGPGVDTGFRIVSSCSKRFITMSIEVAYILALDAQKNRSEQMAGFILHSVENFKGVWNEREYPVFAYDRNYQDKIANLLYRMQGFQKYDTARTLELANACLKDPKWPSKVYVPQDEDVLLTSVYPHLKDEQEKLISLEDTSEKEPGEDKSSLRNSQANKKKEEIIKTLSLKR